MESANENIKGHVHEGIEKRVDKFVQGKHGLIGFILPKKQSTEADWKALHDSIAEIVVRSEKNKTKKEEAGE